MPGPTPPRSLAHRADFALGDVIVRPSLRKVDGPLGGVTGEPRVIQTLVALSDAKGAVLSRDDLLRLCWDGRIVGDDAINRAIAEVRRILATVGASLEVETVPRVGFRLTGIDWDDADRAEQSAPVRGIGRRALLAIGGATVVMAAGGFALDRHRRTSEIDQLIERGRQLQGSGIRDGKLQAATLFRQAIARDPDRADAFGWLAVVVDDPHEARRMALRAVELEPKEPNARTVLAIQLRDLDNWTRWEDALLAVLADAPDCAKALHELTFFYQSTGRCQDSWDTNERAIRREPFSPIARHRRALKLWNFGRVGEADKVVDRGMQLWPRDANMWNARMLIYACTDRAQAGLALLEDEAVRPVNLKQPSIDAWRASLQAVATRSAGDLARMQDVFAKTAPLAAGIAANAIMMSSHLGALDAAYRFAEGLLENRGDLVQRTRGKGIGDVYSASTWGRTQFLFIPACAPFRSDPRFRGLCARTGHLDYWRRRGRWPDPFVRGAIDPAELA